mmetsp:Transcript_1037/g.3550  ORF Transcript_1037/g.3550 Transcript_1037/m.3550 type:complete len:99 (-) Transcript_1037:382-678(-)
MMYVHVNQMQMRWREVNARVLVGESVSMHVIIRDMSRATYSWECVLCGHTPCEWYERTAKSLECADPTQKNLSKSPSQSSKTNCLENSSLSSITVSKS